MCLDRRAIATPASTPSDRSANGYDNTLTETTIELYKTEKINREGPWRTPRRVELATLEWVDWCNHTRLHSALGGRPPVEFEELADKQQQHQLQTQQQLPL